MRKLITCKNFDGAKFYVSRANDSVKFFDYDTNRAYVRKLWLDAVGFQYVWLNGRFVALSLTSRESDGLQFTVGDYAVC